MSEDPPRHPAIRAILAAETISCLGSQLTYLALPWFVLISTGSPARMGLVFGIELLPAAVLRTPCLLVVRRLGAARAMLAGDAGRALLIACIPLLYDLRELSYGLLLSLVCCAAAFSALHAGAQHLVLPGAPGGDEAAMMRGRALAESAARLMTLIGPVAAGMLISWIRPVNVIWVDAASFAVSFVLLAASLPRVTATEPDTTGGALAGATLVLADPLLRRIVLSGLIFALFFPALLASLPVVTVQHFGGNPRIAGLLLAAWGGGALIGLFGVMQFTARLPPIRMGALAALAVAAPLWLLALPLTAWMFGLVLLASGMSVPMLNAPVIALISMRTPERLRTTVITFAVTANLLAGPAGYALAGLALQQFGLRPVLLTAAGGVTVAAILATTIGVPGPRIPGPRDPGPDVARPGVTRPGVPRDTHVAPWRGRRRDACGVAQPAAVQPGRRRSSKGCCPPPANFLTRYVPRRVA